MSKEHECDVCGTLFAQTSQKQNEEMEKLYAGHDDVVRPEICDFCYHKYESWVGSLSIEQRKEILERYMRKKDGN